MKCCITSRNNSHIFILICILALIFTGCGAGVKDTADDVEEMVGYRQDKYLATGTDCVYDISSIALDKEINGSPVYYGMSGVDELRLIYRSNDESDAGVRQYSVYSYDLNAEKYEKLPYEWSSNIDEYGFEPYMTLISINPLILYEYSASKIYMPEISKEPVKIPEGHDGDLIYVRDKLYLVEYKGFISRVTDAGELETKFILPDIYSSMSLSSSVEKDKISVSATSYTGDSLYLDIDVFSWKYKTYTLKDPIFDQKYYREGEIFGLENNPGGEEQSYRVNLTLCSEDSGKKKNIDLTPLSQETLYISLNPSSCKNGVITFAEFTMEDIIKKIYVWDSDLTEGEPWVKQEKVAYSPPEVTTDELTKRSEEIAEKYDVTIKFGNDIRTDVGDFVFEPTDNKGRISVAMDVIEDTLSMYPKGFFTSIENGYVRDTMIYLVSSIKPADGAETISEASGVTNDVDGLLMVFLDIGESDLAKHTLIHELTHVIDRRLEYDGSMDESKWNSMNPEGFDYNYGYLNEKGEDYSESIEYTYTSYYDGAWDEDFADTYFYDTYSETWPTEDRARLMEFLLSDLEFEDNTYHSPHIQEKLKYYFEVIRNDLGTDEWPEETSWEKRLSEIEK